MISDQNILIVSVENIQCMSVIVFIVPCGFEAADRFIQCHLRRKSIFIPMFAAFFTCLSNDLHCYGKTSLQTLQLCINENSSHCHQCYKPNCLQNCFQDLIQIAEAKSVETKTTSLFLCACVCETALMTLENNRFQNIIVLPSSCRTGGKKSTKKQKKQDGIQPGKISQTSMNIHAVTGCFWTVFYRFTSLTGESGFPVNPILGTSTQNIYSHDVSSESEWTAKQPKPI